MLLRFFLHGLHLLAHVTQHMLLLYLQHLLHVLRRLLTHVMQHMLLLYLQHLLHVLQHQLGELQCPGPYL